MPPKSTTNSARASTTIRNTFIRDFCALLAFRVIWGPDKTMIDDKTMIKKIGNGRFKQVAEKFVQKSGAAGATTGEARDECLDAIYRVRLRSTLIRLKNSARNGSWIDGHAVPGSKDGLSGIFLPYKKALCDAGFGEDFELTQYEESALEHHYIEQQDVLGLLSDDNE